MLANPGMVALDLTPTQNGHRNRGIGRYVAGLASALAAQQEVPVEFWGWDEGRPFEPGPPHSAIWLPRHRMPRSRAPWLFAKLAIWRFARHSHARLVHITDPNGLVILPARKTVVTAYDLIPMLEPGARAGTIEGMDFHRYVRQLRKAERVFAISDQTARDLREYAGVRPAAIRLAPPGVDLRARTAQPGIGDPPYFLYLGSPEAHKNVPLIVEAMGLAPELLEHLVIAGAWYPNHIERLLDSASRFPGLRERIDFRGFLPDRELVNLIASAMALLVPSRREGFGLPVAEGLAAGAVVIHSRIPVLEEVSAGAALTFDPASPQELAQCLRRVSGDPELRRTLQQRGLARAKGLTWSATVATTLAVYSELLVGGS